MAALEKPYTLNCDPQPDDVVKDASHNDEHDDADDDPERGPRLPAGAAAAAAHHGRGGVGGCGRAHDRGPGAGFN